jgi:hypothetical protein
MKRLVAIVIASLCFAGSAQAMQAAAAPTPNPRALVLTKRYIAALHIDKTMKPMMQSMLGPLMDQQTQGHPDLTDEQRRAVRETVEDFVGGDLIDQVMERMTPVYATTFSEEELQALVDFYEGPTGQSIVAKMPQLGPATARVMVEMMPEIRAGVTRRICEKLGCEAAPAQKPAGS